MSNYPVAYEGNAPFIFVSYAHKDADRVLPLIDALNERGFRVWYDAGIEAGSEWPEYIAEHVKSCYCMVAFITKESAVSFNCRREINYAINQRRQMIAVYLEQVTLDPGMEMQLGVLHALYWFRYPDDTALVNALVTTKSLKPCNTQQEMKTQRPAELSDPESVSTMREDSEKMFLVEGAENSTEPKEPGRLQQILSAVTMRLDKKIQKPEIREEQPPAAAQKPEDEKEKTEKQTAPVEEVPVNAVSDEKEDLPAPEGELVLSEIKESDVVTELVEEKTQQSEAVEEYAPAAALKPENEQEEAEKPIVPSEEEPVNNVSDEKDDLPAPEGKHDLPETKESGKLKALAVTMLYLVAAILLLIDIFGQTFVFIAGVLMFFLANRMAMGEHDAQKAKKPSKLNRFLLQLIMILSGFSLFMHLLVGIVLIFGSGGWGSLMTSFSLCLPSVLVIRKCIKTLKGAS